MDQIAGHPFWRIHCDAAGGLDAEGAALPQAVTAAGVQDLFVMSHGWGASEGAAENLYQAMFALVADASGQGGTLGPIGYAGVYWPSLWFPDAAPGARSTAVAADVTGKDIASALAPGYEGDAARSHALVRLGELLDTGESLALAGAPPAQQQATLEEFHGLLPSLVTARPHAREDAGEFAVVAGTDPASDYAFLADTMGTAPSGGDAQGLGDVFSKIWGGAKDALRVASYYEMKCRAGDVGRSGLGPLVERLHAAAPTVRVHLVGHSFGARLVSFALAGISSAAASPVASLTLLQGAFSHWSFAAQQPFGDPGALSGVADRVHGPLVATWSPFDWAVGRWYPKASLLSGQDNMDDAAMDRWGGLGGDGFQGVGAATPVIQRSGIRHGLQPGRFHSVDAQSVIRDVAQSPFAGAHSDLRHPEVAWLLVDAATATG